MSCYEIVFILKIIVWEEVAVIVWVTVIIIIFITISDRHIRLIDSLLFEYGNFISNVTSLHESRIETEVNTVQLH